MARDRIEAALAQMQRVRGMLKHFLTDLEHDEWFQQPQGVTNIAWQAGHIVSTQYALCLARTRGEKPEDEELAPAALRKRYGRGSTPDPDPAANAMPEELLSRLDAVAARVSKDLAAYSDADLVVDLPQPHPMFKTKLEAVEFCPTHELMHIGQVVLLRRLIGRKPGR